eukprot:sb/3473372/
MVQERARAAELGYPDPVQDTKPDTDMAYNTTLTDVLLPLVREGHCSLLAGSHNEETVRILIEALRDQGLDKGAVHFGQLYGLCDPTTFQLGARGYRVFKAVAWGPVEAVLPYLARRAQENTGVLGETRELDLLKQLNCGGGSEGGLIDLEGN